MLYTALIIGLAGSFHCIGMCSPLAMAVTHHSSQVVQHRLLYHSGRIVTYGFLGALITSVGFALPLARYQNLLSLSLGVLLIVVGLANFSHIKIKFFSSWISQFTLMLKNIFSAFLQKKNDGSVFLLGIINGLLPCGLTLLALTYCVIMPTPAEGFLFMVLFGAGTLPALLGFTSAFRWVSERFRFHPLRMVKIFVVLSGCLLIARVFIVHLPHTHSFHDALVEVVTCR
ncbi:MAG: sulfite exporter TauE/SafE family protein [Bacteroidetes bacterium]|nr:sulfite exporter TauE/SafE family protein [Bacteroidota bacterium]MBS1539664.1 sulfite exporter TauE/SafE family protein [Bacteroidota bacterium]